MVFWTFAKNLPLVMKTPGGLLFWGGGLFYSGEGIILHVYTAYVYAYVDVDVQVCVYVYAFVHVYKYIYSQMGVDVEMKMQTQMLCILVCI